MNYIVLVRNKGGEEMNFMIASEKNNKIVNKIIEILSEEKCSVREATAILEYTENRIAETSVVGINHLSEDV